MNRLVTAVGSSLIGLQAAWKSEVAFRQETILFLILSPMGIWLGDTPLERVALVGVLFIVLIVELLNSGLETAIDRISGERHPLSKKAKDIGSAAVFVSIANAIVTWAIILA